MPEEKLHLEHPSEQPPSYDEVSDLGSTEPQLSAAEEKAALEHGERLRSEPLPPYSGPSSANQLNYTVRIHKVFPSSLWTIEIAALDPDPHGMWWQLDCNSSQTATMSRHRTSHSASLSGNPKETQQAFQPRTIAMVKFPKVKWTEPKITFMPHEYEIERNGLRHVSPTDRLMECSGFFKTTYALNLPALNSLRVAWKIPGENDTVQAMKLDASEQMARNLARADAKETTPLNGNKETRPQEWSPFPIQQLIEEVSGRILATYSRSAPWANLAGTLTIHQVSGPVTTELIEGIVISCAVMVGMQRKLGLFTSLVESGYDSLGGGKGKGRAVE